jgi:hypothetical protein
MTDPNELIAAQQAEPTTQGEKNGLDRQTPASDDVARNPALSRYYIGALKRGFTTAESGNGQYSLRIKFDSLAAMQAAHDALIWLPSEPAAQSAARAGPFYMTVPRNLLERIVNQMGADLDVIRHEFDSVGNQTPESDPLMELKALLQNYPGTPPEKDKGPEGPLKSTT